MYFVYTLATLGIHQQEVDLFVNFCSNSYFRVTLPQQHTNKILLFIFGKNTIVRNISTNSLNITVLYFIFNQTWNEMLTLKKCIEVQVHRASSLPFPSCPPSSHLSLLWVSLSGCADGRRSRSPRHHCHHLHHHCRDSRRQSHVSVPLKSFLTAMAYATR